MPLEELYEDPHRFRHFVKDHQVKQFALAAEDEPRSYMDLLDVDAHRLELAKQNLERVDVLGLQDRFEEILGELRRRFSWKPAPIKDRNVTKPRKTSRAFRERIAADNAADVEFYEHAVELYERRRAPRRVRRATAAWERGEDGESDRRRIFLVHLQKTAGTTLTRRIRRQFADPCAVYPCDSDGDNVARVISVEHLRCVWERRREEIDVVTGHFPLCVTELLGADFATLTVLRRPLDRTVSYLRHHRRVTPQDADLSLEQVYDDEFRFHGLIHNHMTKMLSLLPEEMEEGVLTRVEFTPERLERAKRRLAGIDLVGVQEDFEGFWLRLAQRFDWQVEDHVPRKERPPTELSDELRERILADNAYDLELYEFARELIAERAPA